MNGIKTINFASTNYNNMSTHTKTKWARVCSATGQGMNQGYLFEGMLMYFIEEEDALKYAIELGYSDLDEAYDDGAYCYTEWDVEDEEYYFEEQPDGSLIEIWK